MACKVEGCQNLGQVCGMCGQASCETHGHQVSAQDEVTSGTVSGWLCNDCSDKIVDAVTPYLPH